MSKYHYCVYVVGVNIIIAGGGTNKYQKICKTACEYSRFLTFCGNASVLL